MIECQFCKATHVVNTIFCDECGQYLLQGSTRSTDPLEVTEIGWVGEKGNGAEKASSLQPGTTPLAIRFIIGANRRQVEMPLSKALTLGRMDPTLSSFPEVDLSFESEQAKSVSRRHAHISTQKGMVLVEDLASINGTFLNGRRLIPFIPEVLVDGDTLQLGKLLIQIKFK
jgi:hypothetical protein